MGNPARLHLIYGAAEHIEHQIVVGAESHGAIAISGTRHSQPPRQEMEMDWKAECYRWWNNWRYVASRQDKSKREIRVLHAGLRAAKGLMDESCGVYGLHLNGDPAPWDSLRTGGKYEEWLIEFDKAIQMCKR